MNMKMQGADVTMIDGLAARRAEDGLHAHARRSRAGKVRADDATLDIEIDGVSHHLHVETKSRWASDVDSQLDRIADDRSTASWILVLPRLDATRRAWLRERGINHADVKGVLYVRMPGVRVHVDGGPKRFWSAAPFGANCT